MHNTNKKISNISISIVGGRKVGKTSLIKCLASGGKNCCQYAKHTLKDDFTALNMKLGGEDEVMLQLWENGAESFNAICILYDVTSRESYEEGVLQLKKIREKHPKLPIMLLANKQDLENKRVVMEYEGEIVAIEHSTLFNEVSCHHGLSVLESAEEFIRSIL
ncbi:ras-related protein Rab-13-like isoform X1 [Clytia hemisphaerica]